MPTHLLSSWPIFPLRNFRQTDRNSNKVPSVHKFYIIENMFLNIQTNPFSWNFYEKPKNTNDKKDILKLFKKKERGKNVKKAGQRERKK